MSSILRKLSIRKKKEPSFEDAASSPPSTPGSASPKATANGASTSKGSSPVANLVKFFSRSSSSEKESKSGTSSSKKENSKTEENVHESLETLSKLTVNTDSAPENIPTISISKDDESSNDMQICANPETVKIKLDELSSSNDSIRKVSFDKSAKTEDQESSLDPGLRRSTSITSESQCDPSGLERLFHEESVEKTEVPQPKVNEKGKGKNKNKKEQTKITTPARTYEEELNFLSKETEVSWRIKMGFVDNMKADGIFFVNEQLRDVTFEELKEAANPEGKPGGFIPALKQIANVAALPGIVKYSIGLPDLHSGYGFAIGNTAAFDMDDPDAIVSPGGVGFDINCGIRLIRTNLTKEEVDPVKESLAQALFDHIPVGVGARGSIPVTNQEIDEAIVKGMDWCVEKGFAWPEDRLHCEEQGRMPDADATKVSIKAKQRGLPQLGTLGAGNHYGEVQYVEEIFDPIAAKAMGITKLGQIVLMVHCGSRGFGHQVATDSLSQMEKAMVRDNLEVNDRQLACAKIQSKEGQDYLAGMSAAANFAWVNRASITFSARKAFSQVFKKDPKEMDMHLVYDVSHNIAKIEEHIVDGIKRKLLVHRKGSTRAFPPHDPRIPKAYQEIGQPVLIGGTMGTCSYVLTGTKKGMETTFGSTCHGAGRLKSRAKSRRDLDSDDIHKRLAANGICVKVASPKLIMEEAPESYKDVVQVIETCDQADISKKAIKLKPLAVIKG